MTTYDTYKDSGIAWLGQIPSHWEVRRTKNLWHEVKSLSVDGQEHLLSVSQYDGITQNNEGSRSESLIGYKIVEPNDLVINIMLAWMGGLGVSRYKGIVSPAYCVYRLHETQSAKYFHYLYRTPYYLAEFARRSTGVIPSRWRMYTDEFGCVASIVPPLDEQEAIVNYLKNATAKIDEAIAQQQKMIDLLKERKQIIINEAVTHGLDPNVPMKQTGIDWLPEIPAHWEFVRIKNIASVKTGKTPPSEDKHYFDNGTVLWFTPADFDSSNIYLNESQRHITQKAISEKVAFLFPPNSVLMIGIGGTLGRIGFCKNSCFSNQQINAIIVNNNYNPIYLAYCLKSEFDYIWSRANTATMPIINQQATKDLLVTCPPFDEQEIIANEIEMKCLPLNEAISRHKRIITLLNERKQIIINDVVTGKIKVS